MLEITYNGSRRTVEPHIYGTDTKGHEALLGYQISGTNPDWRLFHISNIQGLSISERSFAGARGNGTSRQFSHVYMHV